MRNSGLPNNTNIKPILFSLMFCVFSVFGLAITSSKPEHIINQDTQDTQEVQKVQEKVEKIAATVNSIVPTIPYIMQKISWCESRDQQFNADGTVKRGKLNSQDVGKYQINEHYHLDSSKRMGLDIHTLSGNTYYALYLYDTQGTKPWEWSKPCWGGTETIEELKLKYK